MKVVGRKLEGAFSVITNLRMDLFQALTSTLPSLVIIPLTTNTFYNKTGDCYNKQCCHTTLHCVPSTSNFEVQVNFLTRHYPYQKNIICMDGVFTSILRQCNNYKVSYSPSTFYTSDIPTIQIFSSHSFGPLLNSMIWFIKNWLAKVHNQGEEKCSPPIVTSMYKYNVLWLYTIFWQAKAFNPGLAWWQSFLQMLWTTSMHNDVKIGEL